MKGDKMCCGCCCSRSAVLFKLSLMGFMVSLLLMLLGVVPPFSRLVVSFPKAWVLGLFVLIPSITLYYDVRERFWDEVKQQMEKNKKT
jgi:hypothetical protein